jgi:basic membrane lipoprotein Med (substrate-binding protein (PBP1-ABC) superfamily)
VDIGVFNFIKAAKTGSPLGGGNLNFDLANGGMDLGKINPAVPKSIVAKTLALKQLIINGKVTPPLAIG